MTSDRYTFSEEDIKLFLDETLEMLEVLEEEIIKLEEEGEDAELLQDMFRIAHTVKGSAGTIGHTRMSDLAHSMEDVFSRLRDGELALEQGLVNILLDSLDALKNMAVEVTPGFEGEKLDIEPYVTRLKAAISKITEVSETSPLYDISVKFYEDTAMPAVRALQVLQVLDELGKVVESQPSIDQVTEGEMDGFNFFATLDVVQSVTEADIIEAVSDVPDVDSVECCLNGFQDELDTSEINSSPNDSRKILGKVSDHAIRVDVEAFDRLVRITSEMTIEQARLVEMQRRFNEADTLDLELVQGLEQVIGQMSRLSTELQEEVMKARMTPCPPI